MQSWSKYTTYFIFHRMVFLFKTNYEFRLSTIMNKTNVWPNYNQCLSNWAMSSSFFRILLKTFYALTFTGKGKACSSLHNIICESFQLVLVLWRLLPGLSISFIYVIVVQKSSCGDWKSTLWIKVSAKKIFFSSLFKAIVSSISTRTFWNNYDVGHKIVSLG